MGLLTGVGKEYGIDNIDYSKIMMGIYMHNISEVFEFYNTGAFDSIKFLFETEYGYTKMTVKKTDGQIRELGKYFTKNIENYRMLGGKLILPLLHNSANLSFHLTDRFIEPYIDNNESYVSYNEYIAEQISEIMINDPEMKRFLVDLKDMHKII